MGQSPSTISPTNGDADRRRTEPPVKRGDEPTAPVAVKSMSLRDLKKPAAAAESQSSANKAPGAEGKPLATMASPGEGKPPARKAEEMAPPIPIQSKPVDKPLPGPSVEEAAERDRSSSSKGDETDSSSSRRPQSREKERPNPIKVPEGGEKNPSSPSSTPPSKSLKGIFKEKVKMIGMLNSAFTPDARGKKDMTPMDAATIIEKIEKVVEDPQLKVDARKVIRFLRSAEAQSWMNEALKKEAVSNITKLKMLWQQNEEETAELLKAEEHITDVATQDYFIKNFVSSEVREEIQEQIKEKTDKTNSGRLRTVSMPVSVPIVPLMQNLQAIDFALPNDLPAEEQEKWQVLKRSLETDWSVNIFELATQCRNKPIVFVGATVLTQHNLVDRFKINKLKLVNFLNTIENGYNKVPYHNSIHGADVCATLSILLWNGFIKVAELSSCEILASLVAAICHDFRHPGMNNNFLVHTAHDLALHYNDKSCLENMHVAETFKVLRREETNVLETLTKEEYTSARSLMINMILATDGAVHFNEIATFKTAVLTVLEQKTEKKADFRTSIMRMVLHAADISNPAKEKSLCNKWTMWVMDEFFLQGDKERELGIEISPLCDRTTTSIPKSQIGFIDVIVKPCFEHLFKAVPDCPLTTEIMQHLEVNKKYWQDQIQVQRKVSVTASAINLLHKAASVAQHAEGQTAAKK